MKRTPSVFISYSYDTPEHIKWVNRLAVKLRRENIDVRIDTIDTHLGDDLVQYMVSAVGSSDRVIVVCTPSYGEKMGGGAAFEKMLIASELAASAFTNKFIPVLRDGDMEQSIPKFLHTKRFISMAGSRIMSADIQALAKAIRPQTRRVVTSKKKSAKNKVMKSKVAKAVNEHSDVSDVSRIRVVGYSLLGGRGSDGIRYLWRTSDGAHVESVAFNTRRKAYAISDEDRSISAYTTSVSFGCQLQSMDLSCSFCATGRLKYKGNLTAEEIALQNIFMAEYDANCPSWPEVRDHAREFSFMGQGEPGWCYPQVRRAIILTDIAMENIQQEVHRYIVASSGIPEMLDLLIEDLKRKVFHHRVTLHFSLHAVGKERTDLMPVNKIYNYRSFLDKSKEVADLTNDKIAVGILLFENFRPRDRSIAPITTRRTHLDAILSELDPSRHRLDLCDVNLNRSIESQKEVSNERARMLLAHTKEKGFEAKLFSSFGTTKNSGCGMLVSSRAKIQTPGPTTMNHFQSSVDVLRDVVGSV